MLFKHNPVNIPSVVDLRTPILSDDELIAKVDEFMPQMSALITNVMAMCVAVMLISLFMLPILFFVLCRFREHLNGGD